MELKPGYKQTAVGVIPEEWEAAGLGCFWNVTDCKHVTATFVPSGFPVASITEVQSRFVDLKSAKCTTQHFYNLLIEGGRKPQPGDLIMSRNATVGEVAQVTTSHPLFAMGQDVCLLRKKSSDHSTEFLQAVFQSPIILNQLSNLMVGSTFKRANVEQIRNLAVPMPRPPEQRAIAEALSDVDGLLGGLDRLIAKKRDLKQAAMQQLLTGQTRLPGFHGEWEVKELRQCARFCSGTYLAQEDYRDGPFDVQGAGNPMGKHITANFTEPVSVIGRVGTVGRPRFMPSGCWVNNNAGAVVALPGKATPGFINLLLLTMDWSKATSVTAQPFLVIESLLKMEFRFPSIAEQTAITEVLTAMDSELTALERRREKTRALKQAMMQELLTGRTRLV